MSIIKKHYLDSLIPSYDNLEFSSEEMEVIARDISRLSIGSLTSLPMVCAWDRCILRNSCPFYKLDKKELRGHPCLLEASVMRELMENYIAEYELGDTDITDRFLLQELVDKEIMLMRINSTLSLPENSSFMIEEVAGLSPHGEAYYKQAIVPLMDIKLRIENEKRKIIKMMVGDRQEKYKKKAALREKSNLDISSTVPDVKKQLDTIRDELEKKQETTPPLLSPDKLFEE